MQKRLRVKSVPGRRVRDPISKQVLGEGDADVIVEVPPSAFFTRRLRDGDLEMAAATTAAVPKKKRAVERAADDEEA